MVTTDDSFRSIVKKMKKKETTSVAAGFSPICHLPNHHSEAYINYKYLANDSEYYWLALTFKLTHKP